jgi:hypothetical protein
MTQPPELVGLRAKSAAGFKLLRPLMGLATALN